MTKRHLTIATRESPLALAQAEWVRKALLSVHPQLSIDLLGITTRADQWLTVPLTDIGGKGLFVKELEEALLDRRADIAVHSMKDVPMELPLGLCLPAICRREEVRDVFISNHYASLGQLKRGATLGTSSLRRQTQLRALRPDVIYQPLRGNINTRLHRLDEGHFDAIVLAAAGLKRLQLTSRIRTYLSLEELLPAPGQGAIGIEMREGDESTRTLIAPLNDEMTNACVCAERAVSRSLGGNCHMPLAAYAQIHEGQLHLQALIASADGLRLLRAHQTDVLQQAETVGVRVAEVLLQQGAEKILREFVKP